VTSEQVRSDLE